MCNFFHYKFILMSRNSETFENKYEYVSWDKKEIFEMKRKLSVC